MCFVISLSPGFMCVLCVCVGMMGVLCPPLYKYEEGSDSNTTTKETEGISVEVKIVICFKLLNISKTQRCSKGVRVGW